MIVSGRPLSNAVIYLDIEPNLSPLCNFFLFSDESFLGQNLFLSFLMHRQSCSGPQYAVIQRRILVCVLEGVNIVKVEI
jgi:hypothetical protein